MSEPDVEKVEHRPPAPLRPGTYPLITLTPSLEKTDLHDADEPSYFSSASTTPPSTEHGGPEKGRKTAADVPGAEKTTDDGRIIHSWDGPDDPENPFNWSTWYKWVLTVTVCFVSILTGLPAGSYGVGASYYSSQFNILTAPFDNSIWATVSWNIGAAVWPLIFVPLTEAKGRMPGCVISLVSADEPRAGEVNGADKMGLQIFRRLYHIRRISLRLGICSKLCHANCDSLRM